ncbi:MAG TPA: alpha/beta hydrolase [Planctomycetota bacterium]|nr:alpha/beta hydrolase [Planctomycetota bacterium]
MRRLLPFAAILALSCAEARVSAPHVWIGRGAAAFEEATPRAERRAETEVLYATDRAKTEDRPDGPVYGGERAPFLRLGRATVRFLPAKDWETLKRVSVSRPATEKLAPVVGARDEIARLGWDYRELTIVDGVAVPTPEAAAREAEHAAKFSAALSGEIADAGRGDVFLYLHGFDNTFDEAVLRLAQLWHYLGRPGVALAYSWPSGSSGLFGYSYDRESGEYTVGHLKALLRLLGEHPSVERVHVIAHSRGADVCITALRELGYVLRGEGRRGPEALKLKTLVLASPDVDEEVFEQRFVREGVYTAAEKTVVYFSSYDLAIELASVVFGSRRRVGALRIGDFTGASLAFLAGVPQLEFVDSRVPSVGAGHDYLFTQPAAMSDLILLLREQAGLEPAGGRPLTAHEHLRGVRILDAGYLRPPDDDRPPTRRRDDVSVELEP